MKILITGDREWTDVEAVVAALEGFPPGTILVHGACRGADLTCAAVAESLGFIIKAYPADWNTYGRAAGPIRNQQMLNVENVVEEPIDECIAFHNNIENSRGTKDMISRCSRANIKTRLITSKTTHAPIA